jgi:hypothetical protein
MRAIGAEVSDLPAAALGKSGRKARMTRFDITLKSLLQSAAGTRFLKCLAIQGKYSELSPVFPNTRERRAKNGGPRSGRCADGRSPCSRKPEPSANAKSMGWMQDRADPPACERAFVVAGRDPPSGVSPDAAVAELHEVLDSIGDTCPECPPGE